MSREDLITVEDVAKWLNVNRATVYELVKLGHLRGGDVGAHRPDKRRVARTTRRALRFKPSTVQAFIDARESAATRGVLADAAAEGRAAADRVLDVRRPPRPGPTAGPVSQLPGADRYM